MSDMYNGSGQKCTKTNLWNFLGTDQAGPVTDKSAHLLVWLIPDQCNIRFYIQPGVRRKLFISHISKTTAGVEQSPRTLSRRSSIRAAVKRRKHVRFVPCWCHSPCWESVCRQTWEMARSLPSLGKHVSQRRCWRGANAAALRAHAR